MGRATPDQLAELWAALLSSLLAVLKTPKKHPAEVLAIARKFLRDNGQVYPPDEATRKRLEKLQRAYLEALVAAFEDDAPRPTAALLAEARAFLTLAGRSPDLGAPAAARTAAELLALDVPFKTTRTQ